MQTKSLFEANNPFCCIGCFNTELLPNSVKCYYEVSSELLLNGTQVDGYYPITKDGAKELFDSYLQELIQYLKTENLGDDEFYDYFPSAYDQLMQIAYCVHDMQPDIETLVANSIKPLDDEIDAYDLKSQELDLLKDQCTGISLEDMLDFQEQFK